ncbi:hypothetical protein PI95_034240 [Hassallia byssoidea VB512170]|uniref:Uncharacterized protein n=1 Tax=Hassallia byssoidea VB512170 TaxID=1304833 RepID=A0A846HIT9_9CYAN|nr:hypothetical protein [Hassalia byssoidea]NEU77397.1 hypothetical protein [Hassalia byssoidea VB512170]
MASSRGIFRNVNILHEFNASTGTSIIDVYQPGWLNSLDVVNNAKYSGFVTSLRLTIDISSIKQMSVVESDILASSETVVSNNKETFNYNAKKCLSFYMKTANTPLIKIADAYLFNQRPYYYLDLINYFTSAGTFDVAPDAIIACQVVDVGYGLLQGNDRVMLLGCAVEESPDPKPQSVIQTPIVSRMIANNITTTSAAIVNSNINRKGIVFFNNSNLSVYLDTVGSVSTNSYLVKLVPGAYYEAPNPVYTGNFYAITTESNTSIDIREFV